MQNWWAAPGLFARARRRNERVAPEADVTVPDLLASDFDFALPPEAIALRPASPRDSAKLLEVDPVGSAVRDHHVFDLPDLLRAGDVLVLNDTKVLKAQLFGHREGRGEKAAIALTLFEPRGGGSWLAFAKPARRLQAGDRILIEKDGASARIEVLRKDEAVVEVSPAEPGRTIEDMMLAFGVAPLPPYIASRRAADAQDAGDYQTIYAAHEGAVAAPTAGLHFTENLFHRLGEKGIHRVFITLHVGPGTFLPVKAERLSDHPMHAERGEISEEAAGAINRAREAGGRVVAVGTTVLRLIESAAREDGSLAPFFGDTRLFIAPGFRIRAADLLLTNFHLPKSTLFMLVSAFSGTGLMKRAYAHAVASGYRFYSSGDACLLHRAEPLP
jgi:S-adenosylmethionine:tRNA ribosyltransferase-isomerase